MKLSYSKLNMLLTCGQRYKFKYIDKYPEAESEKEIYKLGTELHKIVSAKLLKETYSSAMPWLESVANKVVEEISKRTQIIGSEVKFSSEFEGYEFEGVIDIIGKNQNGYTIYDVKTGEGTFEQVQIYGYFVGKIKQVNVEKVGLVKVNLQTKEVTITEKPFDQQKAVEWLSNAINKLEKQEYIPEPNSFCQYCSYFYICQLAEVVLNKKLQELSLEAKIDLIDYLKRFQKELETSLKQLVENNQLETEKYIVKSEKSSYLRATRKLSESEVESLYQKYGLKAFEPIKDYIVSEFPDVFKEINYSKLVIEEK